LVILTKQQKELPNATLETITNVTNGLVCKLNKRENMPLLIQIKTFIKTTNYMQQGIAKVALQCVI